jgi:hypothetical protein
MANRIERVIVRLLNWCEGLGALSLRSKRGADGDRAENAAPRDTIVNGHDYR